MAPGSAPLPPAPPAPVPPPLEARNAAWAAEFPLPAPLPEEDAAESPDFFSPWELFALFDWVADFGLGDPSALGEALDLGLGLAEAFGEALGEAFGKALADKRGMERYGFALPMDEAEAKVLIDFGGRNWLVWDAEFKREKIGEMPTEMFFHFFKSFSDAAKCNLNIYCKGDNEHHKIEAIFKAFAKAIKMAVKRDPLSNYLPSTKGVL